MKNGHINRWLTVDVELLFGVQFLLMFYGIGCV
jgi:hypothetical protein